MLSANPTSAIRLCLCLTIDQPSIMMIIFPSKKANGLRQRAAAAKEERCVVSTIAATTAKDSCFKCMWVTDGFDGR